MTPIPTDLRTCRRYQRNGLRCTNKTRRYDGWCGQCDGYSEPAPPSRPRPARVWTHEGNEQAFPPIDIADVQDMRIAPWALTQFIRRHGGTEHEAEAQIRTLAEDIILMPFRRGLRNRLEKRWVIATPHFDYRLVLSEELDVIGYATKHVERTWAQVKKGVPSRLRKRGYPLWLRELGQQANAGRELVLSVKAFCLYVKRRGLGPLRQETAKDLWPVVFDALDRALAVWNGSDMYAQDPDFTEFSWHLSENFTCVHAYVSTQEQTEGAVVGRGESIHGPG